MSQKTSINIEDFEKLLETLKEFNKTVHQDWSRVLNQWENLRICWNDEQLLKFETLFQKLSHTYKDCENEVESYIDFIDSRIDLAKKQKHNLRSLITEKLGPGVQKLSPSVRNVVAATMAAQDAISLMSGTPIKTSNVNPSPVEHYQSKPGISRTMKVEDQLSENYKSLKREEINRRKEELNKGINSQKPPKSSSPPDPPKKPPTG